MLLGAAAVVPTPTPEPGEVRLKLVTSGVNPSDVKSRSGRPLSSERVVPHSDGGGTIDAVGESLLHAIGGRFTQDRIAEAHEAGQVNGPDEGSGA